MLAAQSMLAAATAAGIFIFIQADTALQGNARLTSILRQLDVRQPRIVHAQSVPGRSRQFIYQHFFYHFTYPLTYTSLHFQSD